MAYREFTDDRGVHWHVWAVRPGSADRREMTDRRSETREKEERRVQREIRVRLEPGLANGWLVFESDGEKRRLHPIPERWDERSDAELEAMLIDAEPAPQTTRRPSE